LPVGRPQRNAKLLCARGEEAGVADEDEFAGPVDEAAASERSGPMPAGSPVVTTMRRAVRDS
jgi:hypothetical protein